MAINASNTILFKIDPLDYALSQAGQSNKAGAFKTLTTAYALTPDQTESIRRALNTFQPDTFMTGEPALKREIVAVLNNETLEAASQALEQASSSPAVKALPVSQNQDVFVSFLNDTTSVFANDYPCQFEFGGKYYSSATDCFLAQHADLINQSDVMMHVQRAKFGQNPELKEQLLATGNSFLVCQNNDLLGICLMRLRGEYGCTGIVGPGANYLSSMESLCNRCHLLTNELFPDIIQTIFWQCMFQCDYASIGALSCVNTHWNDCATVFWAGFDLKQFCPKGLTILDAQALGIPVDDEPRINSLKVLNWFKKLGPHVENGGLTLLTMCKGLTLNELVKIAAEPELKMNVDIWDAVLTGLGNEPVVDTYVILITNNVFCKSRNKNYDLQKSLVAGHGCEMPTVQEYVALCVFTNKFFNQCLYGRNPPTYGRSSTQVQGYPLVVGGSAPARLVVFYSCFALEYSAALGVGGSSRDLVFGTLAYGH